MNDQEELLVRQSKWNGKRVVLLYWFSLMFIGTAAAAGLGTSILDPKYTFTQYDHSGIEEPWHADDCSPCHDDIIAGWQLTKHSFIIEEFTNATGTYVRHTTSGDIYNKTEWLEDGGCCHKTRWTNDTSVDPSGEVYVWDLGISCAACHIEPGAPYNKTAYMMDPGTMSGFPPSFESTCAGSCHVPGSRGSTWKASGHSGSLDDLLASDYAVDSCLHCMAGQGMYSDTTGTQLDDPMLTPVDCVTCHDPHNVQGDQGVRYDHDLRRASTTELCGVCHVGSYQMITSDTLTHYNTTTNTLDCTDCHGYEWVPGHNETDRFGVTTWVDATFTDLQHNWVTPDDANDCARCHGDENATYWDIMVSYQMNLTELLHGCQDYLPFVKAKAVEAKATSGVSQAKIANVDSLIAEAETLILFVEADASLFHNPDLAEEKLMLAMSKLEAAYTAAVDAIDTAGEETSEETSAEETSETSETEGPTGTTPGFELLGVLLAFSILGVGTVLFHRKRRRR